MLLSVMIGQPKPYSAPLRLRDSIKLASCSPQASTLVSLGWLSERRLLNSCLHSGRLAILLWECHFQICPNLGQVHWQHRKGYVRLLCWRPPSRADISHKFTIAEDMVEVCGVPRDWISTHAQTCNLMCHSIRLDLRQRVLANECILC